MRGGLKLNFTIYFFNGFSCAASDDSFLGIISCSYDHSDFLIGGSSQDLLDLSLLFLGIIELQEAASDTERMQAVNEVHGHKSGIQHSLSYLSVIAKRRNIIGYYEEVYSLLIESRESVGERHELLFSFIASEIIDLTHLPVAGCGRFDGHVHCLTDIFF